MKPSEASGLVSPVKRWKDSVVVWHIQVRLSGAVKWSNRCYQSFRKIPTMHCATGVCQWAAVWCNWVMSVGYLREIFHLEWIILKRIQQNRTYKGFQREDFTQQARTGLWAVMSNNQASCRPTGSTVIHASLSLQREIVSNILGLMFPNQIIVFRWLNVIKIDRNDGQNYDDKGW